MTTGREVRWLLSLALILITTTVYGQVSGQKEKLNVEVVEVPVWVTSGSRPVTGLTKDDFRLFVDGVPQSIDYFEAVHYAKAKPDQVAISSDQSTELSRRRLYLLLFDLHSDTHNLSRARHAAQKFLEKLGPHDVVGVATISDGIQFVLAFTTDRVAAAQAIQTLRRGSRDALALSTPSVGEGSRMGDFQADGGDLEGAAMYTNPVAASQLTVDFKQRKRTLYYAGVLDNLDQIIAELMPLEGEKHVVLLSDGVNMPVISREESFAARLMELFGRYRSAGLMIDTVNIAGMPVPGGAVQYLGAPTFSTEGETLISLAVGTGGVSPASRNDLLASLEEVRQSTDVSYLLSFHSHASGKGNTIRVELTRAIRSATLRYRNSFDASSREPAAAPRSLELADALLNDYVRADLRTEVSVNRPSGKSRITLTVEGDDLMNLAQNARCPVQILYYVFEGDTQKVTAWHSRSIIIDMESREKTIRGKQIAAYADFELPPGTYTAKVLGLFDGGALRAFGRKTFVVNETAAVARH